MKKPLPAEPSSRVGSIRPLTAFRFFAAAMIVIQHGFADAGLRSPGFSTDSGVSFFFVLSGFVLAYRYPKLDDWAAIKRFLIFRIGRIWPAHAVTALIAAAFLVKTVDVKLAANLGMVHAWIPIPAWFFSYNPVSWSISTEFFFYLSFVFLIQSWTRTLWWKVPACMLILWGLLFFTKKLGLPDYSSYQVSVTGLLYVGPLARLLEFVAGMTMCAAFGALYPSLRRAPIWLFSILEVAVLLAIGYSLVNHPLMGYAFRIPYMNGNYIGHADSWPFFALVLLVFAFEGGVASRLLAHRIPVLLGEASYSLYLVHYMILGWLAAAHPAGGWPLFLFGACLSQGAALLLFFVVESPARSYVRRRFGRPAVPLAQAEAVA